MYLRNLIMAVLISIIMPAKMVGQSKPNFILIMTDDQGYGDFGITGNDLIETPAINKFAHESVRFERFYVSPVCAPTRASLLTGRYYLRTGVTGVTRREETMNTEEVTIAELLGANGYATGCFGKWHNGANFPFDPIGQGFDEFWGFTGGIIRNYFDTRVRHNQEMVEMEGYLTDFFTDKAIEFIETNQQQPFFAYIPYNVPHTPIQVPDPLFEKYLAKGLDEYTAGIYAMCETVDHNLEKLLNRLESLGIAQNTVVIFLTDNGPNGTRFNGGMKGKKGGVDEGGVRVPLWIRWKNTLPSNRIVTALADHIDILPTIMDLAGLKTPDTLQLDGRSLKPLLEIDQYAWPERNLFSFYNGKGAIRNNSHRLTVSRDDKVALYDMLADPAQLTDLSGKLPDKKNALYQKYQTWLAEVNKESTVPPIHLGHPEQPVVMLPTAGGNLSGALKYKNKNGYAFDWATNWVSAEDEFSWEVQVVNDGIYEIYAQHLLPPGSEGAQVLLEISDQKVRQTIKSPYIPDPYPNPDQVDRGRLPEMKWKDFHWGNVKLRKGNYQVRLRATKIPGESAGELYGLKVVYRTNN